MTAVERKRNMLDSLPQYYVESPEVNAIMGGNATEIQRRHEESDDLLAQMHVRTATWGLAYWERVLDLPPRPNSSLSFRRSRILARLNGTAPATVAYLTDVVNTHVADKSGRITEVNGEYRFIVDIETSGETDMRAIGSDLNELKPAHLDYAYRQTNRSAVYLASVLTVGEDVAVYPWSPTSIELRGTATIGSFIYDYDTTAVFPKGEV